MLQVCSKTKSNISNKIGRCRYLTSSYKMKYYFLVTFFISINGNEYFVSVKKLQEIANNVNTATNSTWQAAIPGPIWSTDGSDVNFKPLLGAFDPAQAPQVLWDHDDEANNCKENGLPKCFDAREHWPECASVIGHVYDQGNCGSCWAIAPASVVSDRVCIESKGKITSLYSIQQLLSCCHECKVKSDKLNGCEGGWPSPAWAYIKTTGLSTGGDYGSKQGCQPYLIEHCDHHLDVPVYASCSSQPDVRASKCEDHCNNTSYKKSFKEDRIKVEKYYKISPCAAQNEIHKYGSIAALFTIYEDFPTYKSGIYQHITGKKIGLHIIRVIGWGEEKGIPYWLAVNSWNKHWGEKGYVKILRGSNDVRFEDNLSAGRPKMH
ncbi:cathepsin B-like cysteine proteinase 1 [Planococcus citri]|uniref:cathepsin B-like cysteine proteinase 1 n=1 Tax=Planococcus citri TaxID=170843 RepID=UPI0031F83418